MSAQTNTHIHLSARKPANKQLTAQEFQTNAIITTNNAKTDSYAATAWPEGPQSIAKRNKKYTHTQTNKAYAMQWLRANL